jgi:hypothetical protein
MELHEVEEAAEGCRRRFLAERPPRVVSGEMRRAGPWVVHPVEHPAAPEQAPTSRVGDEPEQSAPPPPVPRQ